MDVPVYPSSLIEVCVDRRYQQLRERWRTVYIEPLVERDSKDDLVKMERERRIVEVQGDWCYSVDRPLRRAWKWIEHRWRLRAVAAQRR